MAYIMHEIDTQRMWTGHLSGGLWEGFPIFNVICSFLWSEKILVCSVNYYF